MGTEGRVGGVTDTRGERELRREHEWEEKRREGEEEGLQRDMGNGRSVREGKEWL